MTTIPAVVGLVRALERLKSEYGGTNVQAGPDAARCPRCKHRTVHQYAKVCMAPGCTYAGRFPGRFQPDAASDHEFGVPGAGSRA
jgi:hypothetical protein